MLQPWRRLRLPVPPGVAILSACEKWLGTKRGSLHLNRCLTGTEKALMESGPGDPRDAGNDGSLGEGLEPTDSSLGAGQRTALPGNLSGRRKRAWQQSLSPLERISQLVPAEFVSPEVKDLKIVYQEAENEGDGAKNVSSGPIQKPVPVGEMEITEPHSPGLEKHFVTKDDSVTWDMLHATDRKATAKNLPFKAGDLFVAEFHKKYYLEFKKMCTLTDSGKLMSNWGAVSHKEIIGKLPGQMLKTSLGFEFLLKRPSLEEFVLLMKRGPTVSYPKDIKAMLMMMDISPGDVALEAGSGSGGMTLFLSRAGSQGCILSFDVRNDHHRIAKKNYERWRTAWKVAHEEEWPDNVNFINKDIVTAAEDIKSITFDAIALDMLSPQVALPVVFTCLKQGGVCTVYIANITQVIDLLEGIRACQLPLLCEKICEVTHRDWLVVPSKQKDGSISRRVEPQQNAVIYNQERTEELEVDEPHLDEVKPFGSVPYIARPYPWQTGHTAFLVKLRKFKPAHLHPELEASNIPQGNTIA
ncbi:tRNA (adenine(58)-N(1))-methyltransferase, mitochondrial isoform X2 [Rhinatrema bivittatum]|uniref:tRNA (adenine(58)-N(1))-methyltransferase, mitochondrial isoform X2 n=1 Tax=Rhinatrema bivittatum TaxID=194408 RepID=UPI00112B6A38|nr:tRNA (adenine(58)-N(1))-methyltransferase, mitochondrial isoform X2 [Rhinatrema bivittatum]